MGQPRCRLIQEKNDFHVRGIRIQIVAVEWTWVCQPLILFPYNRCCYFGLPMSVTIWLDGLFNIWPFETIKICPKAKMAEY